MKRREPKRGSLFSIACAALTFAPALLFGQVREVRIESSLDGSVQPAFFYAPKAVEKPVPLLVALHSWSSDYRQKFYPVFPKWCVEKGWAYIHPNFRGPNRNPQATGSELAVQDVLDAVAYAKKHAKVDENRILLVGASGGGYMSLLMAGRAPDLWAGGSSWAPISDLSAWHAHTKAKRLKYAREIEKSCGGAPGKSKEVDEQYRRRSPLTHLPNAKGKARLDINAGIFDGHKGSVPVSHSLLAFNAVANEADQLTQAEIDEFVRTAKVPKGLVQAIDDPSYGKKKPLFRRVSGKARVTLFDGGHELVPTAAIAWLAKQTK
ncbi:MAG: prolyl oligopeptidase family serine peptidase [Opitutales bacterium]